MKGPRSSSDFENGHGKCSKLKGRRCLADVTNKRDEKVQPLTWNELPENLQKVLPDIHNFTYMVDKVETLPTESFTGAPVYAFEAIVRINITDYRV